MDIRNDDHDSTRGRLLVATPALRDPNFDRAVIFMLEHGPEGALGVVINRASELPVTETFNEWADLTAQPAKVFVGGPVSQSSVIALAVDANPTPDSAWTSIVGDLGTVDLEAQPADVPGLCQVRMFAGYAGWESGQLEGELLSESWFVIDTRNEDVFDPDPQNLWWKVLGRQHGALGRLRNYPADPWVN